VFLNSYSPQQAKLDYLENLALANFTDDFFARIWEAATPIIPEHKLPTIIVKRFREKYGLDETIVPDSWVAHMLDEVLKSAKQRMYTSLAVNGGISGMDMVENATLRALQL
jgi:hypothetical protein